MPAASTTASAGTTAAAAVQGRGRPAATAAAATSRRRPATVRPLLGRSGGCPHDRHPPIQPPDQRSHVQHLGREVGEGVLKHVVLASERTAAAATAAAAEGAATTIGAATVCPRGRRRRRRPQPRAHSLTAAASAALPAAVAQDRVQELRAVRLGGVKAVEDALGAQHALVAVEVRPVLHAQGEPLQWRHRGR
jgi:hypothetical protein